MTIRAWQLACGGNGRGAAGDAERAVNVFQMLVDCSWTAAETVPDRGIGQAACHKARHLPLPGGEICRVRPGPDPPGASRSARAAASRVDRGASSGRSRVRDRPLRAGKSGPVLFSEMRRAGSPAQAPWRASRRCRSWTPRRRRHRCGGSCACSASPTGGSADRRRRDGYGTSAENLARAVDDDHRLLMAFGGIPRSARYCYATSSSPSYRARSGHEHPGLELGGA